MWLFEYRELIRNLVIRDLKVKYKSSTLGFGWSILNPLLMMSVLVLVFSNMMNMNLQDSAIYTLCGLTVWRFFANGTTASVYSLIDKAHIIKRIYFPREVLVFSSVLAYMISSLLEFVVFFSLLLLFGGSIHWSVILFPVLLLLEFLIVFGVGLIVSIAAVYFRDVLMIWEVVLQAGFFLAPIIYQVSIIPERYAAYYMLNPIAKLLLMDREVLIYGTVPALYDFIQIIIACVLILVLGNVLFMKYEPRIAEVI